MSALVAALCGCEPATTDSFATAGYGGLSAAGASGDGGALSGGGSGSASGSAGTGGNAWSGEIVSWQPRAGCGKDPGQTLGQWQQYFVPLSGETLETPQTTHPLREVFVRLPTDYDNMTAYRVVYIGVGCGASDGATAAYPLFAEEEGGDPNAIYVALSLPDPSLEMPCYDVRTGVDSIEWESFENDHAFVTSKFCVDDDKVYMGGFSSGGWLANMYSCYFGGIPDPPRKFLPGVALRGAMAVSSCWMDGNPACNGPVGGLFIQDELDAGLNTLACAQAQRDRLLAQNGCSGGSAGPTEAWGTDFVSDGECLKYTACPAEYPVVFCTTQGVARYSARHLAIPGFTRLISEMEAAAP